MTPSANIPTISISRRLNLNFNLGLRDVCLASISVGNLLGLGQLGTDCLNTELINRKSLDSINTQLRVGLDDGESSRN